MFDGFLQIIYTHFNIRYYFTFLLELDSRQKFGDVINIIWISYIINDDLKQ